MLAKAKVCDGDPMGPGVHKHNMPMTSKNNHEFPHQVALFIKKTPCEIKIIIYH